MKIKPYQTERRFDEQMHGTVDKQVEIFKVRIESNVVDDFGIELHCINAEKPVLTYLPNLRISELKQKNNRLRRLVFSEETVTAEKLPVYIILGAADIQRIKSNEPAVLESNPDSDPGAEFTMLGYTEAEKGFFLKSSHDEFTQICSQEVLGLTDVENTPALFHESAAAAGRRNLFNEVTLETGPCPIAFKQRAHHGLAKEHN